MKLAELIRSNIRDDIDALYSAFQQLGERDRVVLTVLSAVYKPISITKLNSIVDMLLDKGLLPQSLSSYHLSPAHRAALVQQKLLLQSKDGLQVNALLSKYLVEDSNFILEHSHNSSLQEKQTENASHPPMSEASHNIFIEIIMRIEELLPLERDYKGQLKDIEKHRLLRNLFFMGKLSQLEDALNCDKNPQIVDHRQNKVLLELLFLPFDLRSFLQLPLNIQYQAFASLIATFEKDGQASTYPIELLEKVCASQKKQHKQGSKLHRLLAQQYLLQMRLDDFLEIQPLSDKTCFGLQLVGTYYFLTAKNKEALEHFQQAIAAKNKFSRRKKQYLHGILGYFYKLALIAHANQQDIQAYDTVLEQIEFERSDRKLNCEFSSIYNGLISIVKSLKGEVEYSTHLQYNSVSEQAHYLSHQLDHFHFLLAQVWCKQSLKPKDADLAKIRQTNFELRSYPLFGIWCKQLASFISNRDPVSERIPAELVNITTLVKSKSQWDVALDKLIALNPNAEQKLELGTASPPKAIRLIWELKIGYEYSLQGREQKLSTSGWSKGRILSLKQLKTQHSFWDYLSDSDRKICRSIQTHQAWGYAAKTEYSLQGLSALSAAVGIDNLYLEGDLSQSIELLKREPELLVSEQGEQLCLSIADLPDSISNDAQANLKARQNEAKFSLKQVSAQQYQLTVFSDDHLKVAEIIGEDGLLIPISAKQKALDSIAAIAPLLNIQSDIQELDTGLETRDCDPHLMVNIEPTKNGLAFTCIVMPFGEQGPAFTPGLGNASLSTDMRGKRVATQRDLIREQGLLDALDKACSVFLQMSGNRLVLDDLQTALSALEQLNIAAAEQAFPLLLRWPKGKKIRLSKALETQHLQLALSKNNEWFDIGGSLQIDNEDVVDLRKLLDLVKSSNGRFIALGSEQILALSQDLKDKLEQITHLTDNGKFHPLASLQVEQATRGMRMKTLHAWDEQTTKMHEANSIEPKLPSSFQAQLRDYQLAGFDWGMRLAHWGAGACLADDMGLGKTLQALAIILARADSGPSLVIAPTSVCLNWQQEAQRFTPTLNIRLFADSSTFDERTTLLEELDSFDCIIISYGLLQRESDMLSKVHWQTIVADEAQALKNPLAKRTKAVYALKAGFKMITTGTPIENDLTELWSLFRFINPGLLGNLKRFAARFAVPMENAKDDPLAARKASQALKALIQPFILRRMKNQVLTELPPRTEITIPVTLSKEEQTFYEALRLNAIDNISQSSEHSHNGTHRIKMLAELVKLRQACCHPKLVIGESELPSAKLAALDELLIELKLNQHKALIFSQFVGHLQLIKSHLDAAGYSYQYLDGSTPQKERQKRVDAFQRGEGDIFLISLKAGGFGLNLTAADYVIHMDPWWNPAVEDQASDRAHRMGQMRPVTIYRLIAQHTIEEKIVALHQQKRDLADTLLAGNDTVSKLSVEDMLNLLKETF